MKRVGILAACVLAVTASAFGEVKVAVDHNKGDDATAAFKFKNVPSPAASSAATTAKIRVVEGDRDENGATTAALRDGKIPASEDEPASNFFLAAGGKSGRLVIDLGKSVNVKQINTYSWHSDTRAPQVYTLYGNDGDKFDAKQGVDPTKAGWKLIAKVDTREKGGDVGGQYGVSISDSAGNLGAFKALLMVVSPPDEKDDFSNTFYSEIVVVDADAKAVTEVAKAAEQKEPGDTGGIRRDLAKAFRDMKTAIGDFKPLADAEKRKELAPKAEPIFKNIIELYAKLQAADPRFAGMAANETVQYQIWLAVFGDAEAEKALAKVAADEDEATAIRGKVAQQRVRWIKASGDAKAQQAVLDDMQKLAAEHPGAGAMVSGLKNMQDLGAATPELADAAEAMIADKLTSAEAKEIGAARNGKLKQKAAMNKPIVFAGPTVDGKEFSTASLKGKVILIDFWATWCGPCIAENPRIKGLYAKYHDKGFEIVGISCDGDGGKLAEFIKKNEMNWPQLWDKAKQQGDDGWHALAKDWGVMAIPQMFMIDRAGNLRSVEARENMEELIPKLLDEKTAN